MGNFTFSKQEIWSCNECIYCSTKRHFVSDGDSLKCALCNSPAEKIGEQEPSTGMSDFKYRQLLTTLEEDADGVGSATVENIESHFEDGDDFLDAAKAAYTEREFGPLKEVDGVGDASAKSIALTIGAAEGWEDTAILDF